MKKYLQTLHTKPTAHKKRFALLVSGLTTLAIFGIWSFVVFGRPATVADTNANNDNLAAVTQALPSDNTSQDVDQAIQVTPFQEIISGIKSSFQALQTTLKNNGQ